VWRYTQECGGAPERRTPDRSAAMARQVTCECGYIARGGSEEEVVELIQQHLRTDHPHMVSTVSRDDIRGWVEIVPG
jgi:predicted small metal-binding protein